MMILSVMIAATVLGTDPVAVVAPVSLAPIGAPAVEQCSPQGKLGIVVQGGLTARDGIVVQGGKTVREGIVVQGGKTAADGIVVQGGRVAPKSVESSVKTPELGAPPQAEAIATECGKAKL